ncbi:hypothetical protein Zmor_018089 [Zophobas morio]|uniref:WD repeat-containing protein 18 n=1 Tax=Zophobas morio TaxID=2755281 RepID=A0AA38I6A1_9CUCU|nr:hypothetical protein Zmor_018089 [Zophobas morio]
MELQELILTTCRSTQQSSACLWDQTTGNALHYYKNGGVIAPKTLTLLGNDYIMSADEDKPVTHIWPLNSQEPEKKMSTVLPDKITTMALCPDSCYLAAGIGVRLYIWHLPSGKLFSIQKKNFQPISCIKFSSDGSCVIVAGQDGMLIVYKLVSLVSLHNNLQSQSEGQIEPLYTKHDHTLPITDVHVGSFGHDARFATVSSDNTCKVYSLKSGTLLLNLVFEEALTAVIFDGPCWNLYVGRNSGKIQQFFLKAPPRNVDQHVGDLVFSGHQKRITCLDLGVSNGVLVSGAEDNFVFIWEISSRQILKRIEHKGAITNVKCLLKHDNFFTQNLKHEHVVRNLDRDLIQSEVFDVGYIQDCDIELSDDECETGQRINDTRFKDLKVENAKLRATNQQLYETALRISQKYTNF